jgi:carbamoyltransferase|tara:strand:- start:2072 stop:3919 length:1848 start_codon:yes stop_codon:yes gene_type:complete
MSKTILGISAFYHDSAAAVVREGKIEAAAQEERFTRIKHDERFPDNAISYCLEHSETDAKEIDYIAFYEKPFLKFDRLIETYLAYAPRGFRSFCKAMPQWLRTKLHHPRVIRKALGKGFDSPILFIEHHMSHAASAFFPSPFEKSAIVTLDGVGEWDTTSIAVGEGNRIEMLKSLKFPHSIGLLYSAFTYFLGFRVNSGEYKLMGLAPYGHPEYVSQIEEKLLDVKEDGSFALNMDYFTYPYTLAMVGKEFERLFGFQRRRPENTIRQEHMDLAASIQVVAERLVLNVCRQAKKITGADNLCLAGGVALNCVANGKLLKSGLFKKIWIQPASGDAGGALGAALFAYYQLLNRKREISPQDSMEGSRLGPSYSPNEIEKALKAVGAHYERYSDEEQLLKSTAERIAGGKIVGWFNGRMEFGPRALGGRSILGDPRSSDMQSRMNLKIKYRESFRPFAPSVLTEDAPLYFDLAEESPYMLIVAPINETIRAQLAEEERKLMEDADLTKRVNVRRSDLPAITHVDMSARIQTVDAQRGGRYFKLLQAFKEATGCGVLVNTSFNVRGEPIVNTPMDAIRCFLATEMDTLVIEDFVLHRDSQPEELLERFRTHIENFKLD